MQDLAPSVLSRKTQAHRIADASRLAPEKALSVAVLRACDKGLSMHAAAGAVRGSVVSLAEVLEALPEKGMVATLTGPGSALGLVTLDVNALSALVEQLTMGRVLGTEPEERRATRTDAALLCDWLNEVLAGMVGEIIDAAEDPVLAIKAAAPFDGYGFGALMPDPRPLSLMLEDVAYRCLDVTVAFGEAARPGRIVVALVDRPPEPEPIDDMERAESWKRDMASTLSKARAELTAVLHRVDMPIGRLRRLAPGDLIPIPAAAIGEVRMEASDDSVVAFARLGQSMGQRAVRLVPPPREGGPFAEEDTPQGLPAPRPDQMDIGLDRLPVTDVPDIPMPDLPEIDLDGIDDAETGDAEGFPDFPDLSDLPDLGDMDASDGAGLPDLDGLPALDDLPDLDNLPGFDDLPDLGDMAAASGGSDDFPALGDLPRIE